MKTVSQHRAETRHKQDAPGHYTLVSCMRLRFRCLCCRVYVVIVALAILNSRMMLVCYYRGRFAVLTMLMCYDRGLAMLALCVLHVCSSLSSASALNVPRDRLILTILPSLHILALHLSSCRVRLACMAYCGYPFNT